MVVLLRRPQNESARWLVVSKHTDLNNREGISEGDRFNWLHRHEAGLDEHYITDIDMVLIDKNPLRTTGFIEFKMKDEAIRFTQAVAYESLRKTAPVFIVRAEQSLLDNEPPDHTFTIERFNKLVEHRTHPPEVDTDIIERSVSWGGLIEYTSPREFHRDGGDGLIGWEHRRRNPHKILTQ